MARCFTKVSEEEIVTINEAAFFYPSDLVNTKTTIPLRVGEEGRIHTLTLHVSVYICYGLNFSNWFNFHFLLSCIYYHNLEQWQ